MTKKLFIISFYYHSLCTFVVLFPFSFLLLFTYIFSFLYEIILPEVYFIAVNQFLVFIFSIVSLFAMYNY